MSNRLAMPTEDELAEMSYSELHQGSLLAFYQWQEKKRLGEDTTESEKIFHAFDDEMSKRLERFKQYLA